MTGNRYLALLRGINVGGRNIIRMTDLAECFEGMGCTGVVTYIQSGNVVFSSGESDPVKLASEIEEALSARFAYDSRIVLLSRRELRNVVQDAPSGFGQAPDVYKYDVLFLRDPLAAVDAIKSIKCREGVDAVYEGSGVLYASRLISRVTQSRLSKLAALPIYQEMTIRNWNTTTRLWALMEQARVGGE